MPTTTTTTAAAAASSSDCFVDVIDNLTPEEVAMLQALYSRSAVSVREHLRTLTADRSASFMEKVYVGYNHKSIGDCGSTTLFIENVSVLAAKAIQNSPLYKGQETSTRYIDMANQAIVDPVDSLESGAIHDRWMNFYVDAQAPVQAHVQAMHPQRAGERDDHYAVAVKARTFDILRGFLPAGICTQLSWHTDLRQAHDHLPSLIHHPAHEIRQIGLQLLGALHLQYPHSGFDGEGAGLSGEKSVAGKEAVRARAKWQSEMIASHSYLTPKMTLSSPASFSHTISHLELSRYQSLLSNRPRGAVAPHFLTDLGQITMWSTMDFGAFRDLQRHRNGVCRMPMLTTDYGFEPWYIHQLPPGVADKANRLISEQEREIMRLETSAVERQYYMALGHRVAGSVTYGLPATMYVLELRSGKTIHPTLRQHVQRWAQDFRAHFPHVPLHDDRDPDDWTVRRGAQTIVVRP